MLYYQGFWGFGVLGFWADSYKLHICSAINEEKNHCYNTVTDLPTNRYTQINIKQAQNTKGVYFFVVRLDGKEVYRVQNNQPQTFQNLKLYQSDPWYLPAKAFIRKVEVKTTKV